MSVTITRLFDTYADAIQGVTNLEEAGLSSSDISIVCNNSESWYTDKTHSDMRARVDSDRDGKDDRAEGAETGAGIGAILGGAAGLLAGLGMLAIPGVGPAVAAGWLVSTAAGAATVGVAGGIIGALTQAGVSKEDAVVYEEGIRRGGCIVTARVPDGEMARFEAILDRASVNLLERQSAYRESGWKGLDNPPL